jgi:N-acyl homoserine lactone hydrolase
MVRYKQIVKGLNIRPKIGFFGYSSITLVKDGEETILFDTGGPAVRNFLFDYIQKIKIDKVFISHLHLDHCSNIDLFPETPIYLNNAELDNLLSVKNDFNDKMTYLVVDDYLKKNHFELFEKEFQLTKNIHVLSTQGHTCGHSSLNFKSGNDDVILAGDAIETYREYLSDKIPRDCGDCAGYLKTKKFIKTNFDVVVPGHSSTIIKGKIPEDNLKLIYF